MKTILLLILLAALGAIVFVLTSWIIALLFGLFTNLSSYVLFIARLTTDGERKLVFLFTLLLLMAFFVFAI
jgi:hypothetical protein